MLLMDISDFVYWSYAKKGMVHKGHRISNVQKNILLDCTVRWLTLSSKRSHLII